MLEARRRQLSDICQLLHWTTFPDVVVWPEAIQAEIELLRPER